MQHQLRDADAAGQRTSLLTSTCTTSCATLFVASVPYAAGPGSPSPGSLNGRGHMDSQQGALSPQGGRMRRRPSSRGTLDEL